MKSFLIHALRARALVWPFALIVALLLLCATASAQLIPRQAAASSGSTMKWERGSLIMTVGQAAAGRIVNSAVDIHSGFLPPPGSAVLAAGRIADRELRIHPLPARDNFFVEMPALPSLALELYDIAGRLYLTERNVTGRIRIDLTNIPPGGYFLCVLSGSDVIQTKLITVIR